MKTYKSRNNRKKRVLKGGAFSMNALGGVFTRKKSKLPSTKETLELLVDALGGIEKVKARAEATRKDRKAAEPAKESAKELAVEPPKEQVKEQVMPGADNDPRVQESRVPMPVGAAGSMPPLPMQPIPPMPPMPPGGGGSIARKTRRKLRRRR